MVPTASTDGFGQGESARGVTEHDRSWLHSF